LDAALKELVDLVGRQPAALQQATGQLLDVRRFFFIAKLSELRFAQERIAPERVQQIGNGVNGLADWCEWFMHRCSDRRIRDADVGNSWPSATILGGQLGINTPELFLQLRAQGRKPRDIFGMSRRFTPDPARPIFFTDQLQEEWLGGDNLG